MTKLALLVEDDEDAQITSKALLKLKGYETELAENLVDARIKLESQQYDLYIIDGNFPRESVGDKEFLGVDFYNDVIGRHPDAKAYLFTNIGSTRILELRNKGINAYEKHKMFEVDL